MLAIVGIILLFANARGLRLWLRFSLFYIPIAVALSFWIYPLSLIPGGTVFPVSYGVYPFGRLYVLLTLGIVLWTWWKGSAASRSA